MQGDGRQGLAEAHVVREQRAEAQVDHVREPGQGALLVVAQRRFQGGRRGHGPGLVGGAAQRADQGGQGAGGPGFEGFAIEGEGAGQGRGQRVEGWQGREVSGAGAASGVGVDQEPAASQLDQRPRGVGQRGHLLLGQRVTVEVDVPAAVHQAFQCEVSATRRGLVLVAGVVGADDGGGGEGAEEGGGPLHGDAGLGERGGGVVVEAGQVWGGQGDAVGAFLGGEVRQGRVVAGGPAQRAAYSGQGGGGELGPGVLSPVPDSDRCNGVLLVGGGEVQDGRCGRDGARGVGFLDAQHQARGGVGIDGVLDRVRPPPQLGCRLGVLAGGPGVGAGSQEGGGAGGAEHGVGDGVEQGPHRVFGGRDADGVGTGEEAVSFGGHQRGDVGDGGVQGFGDRADAPAALALVGQGGVDALLRHAREGQAQRVAPSGDRGVLSLAGIEDQGEGESERDGHAGHGGAARHDATGPGQDEVAGDRLKGRRQ